MYSPPDREKRHTLCGTRKLEPDRCVSVVAKNFLRWSHACSPCTDQLWDASGLHTGIEESLAWFAWGRYRGTPLHIIYGHLMLTLGVLCGQPHVEGSDHCPVYCLLRLSLPATPSHPPPLCTCWIPGFAHKQSSIADHCVSRGQKRALVESADEGGGGGQRKSSSGVRTFNQKDQLSVAMMQSLFGGAASASPGARGVATSTLGGHSAATAPPPAGTAGLGKSGVAVRGPRQTQLCFGRTGERPQQDYSGRSSEGGGWEGNGKEAKEEMLGKDQKSLESERQQHSAAEASAESTPLTIASAVTVGEGGSPAGASVVVILLSVSIVTPSVSISPCVLFMGSSPRCCCRTLLFQISIYADTRPSMPCECW
jgi:hypothetical protein